MRRIVAWACVVLVVLVWTWLSYSNQPDVGLRDEILIRHFLVNSALSFPTSLLLGLIAEAVAGPCASGLGRAALISVVCFISGYIQWLVLAPRVLRWWKSHREDSR